MADIKTITVNSNTYNIADAKLKEGFSAATVGQIPTKNASGGISWNTINSAQWGNITGEIENQTDLNTALNGKAASISATGSATRPVYFSAKDTPAQCTYGFGVDATGPYIESF